MNKLKVVYPYNRILFNLKKEWSTDTYYKVEEPRKHNVNGKESVTRGHILCKTSRTGKYRDGKKIRGCQGLGQVRIREIQLMGLFWREMSWNLTITQTVNHLSTIQETLVWSLGREDPLEKEMAIHSSTIAWEIPWTEEPGGLWPMGWRKSWTWLS